MGRELLGEKGVSWWEGIFPVERELSASQWEESFPVGREHPMKRELLSEKRASQWEKEFPSGKAKRAS